MDVTRKTALEIFGLSEGFTKEDVNRNFRRLSKIVHPDVGGDENLFKFIICCKEKLCDKKDKKVMGVDLTILYKIYDDLDSYNIDYNQTYIFGGARIFITPCIRKNYMRNQIVELVQPFKQFKELNFVSFSATVKLPEELKNFNKFKICVNFMGKTYKFKLSMKKTYHIIEFKSKKFNSIIELNIE